MGTNPEIDQDRVEDTIDHFKKFGYVMFPQQRKIYQNIAFEISVRDLVLEAGCGMGLGTAILQSISEATVIGTDKLQRNVDFAGSVYPWLEFYAWDINQPNPEQEEYATVVCVETIEHVANPKQAIKNLLDVCTETIWISTPNGTGKERPPSNPYHVCEYTPKEMIDLFAINGQTNVTIHHWDTMEELRSNTLIDPLIYKVKK